MLPLVTREVVSLLHAGGNSSETLDLSTFGFLYGTFPTAPAVFVFSNQYNLETDLVRILYFWIFLLWRLINQCPSFFSELVSIIIKIKKHNSFEKNLKLIFLIMAPNI